MQSPAMTLNVKMLILSTMWVIIFPEDVQGPFGENLYLSQTKVSSEKAGVDVIYSVMNMIWVIEHWII